MSSADQDYNILHLTAEDLIDMLSAEINGTHIMIIYPDIDTIRQFYSSYIKNQIEEKNKVVVFAPYYETMDSVRRVLSIDNTPIDALDYEKDDSLVIVDAAKVYRSNSMAISLIHTMAQYAKDKERNGITLIADTGGFHYRDHPKDLIEYELLSLPRRFRQDIKGFCLYHHNDFKMLSEDQKSKLSEHHGMAIELVTT